MPPLPAIAKVLRVALIHNYGVKTDVITRFFMSYGGAAPTSPELNTFATAVATSWNGHLAGQCGAQVALTAVDVIDLTSAVSAAGSAAVLHAGVRVGTELSANDCAVISYEILRRYRGGHPRGYWPFGIEADLGDPQHWNAAFVLEFTSHVNDFLDDVTAAGWAGSGAIAHVNVSYFHGFTVVINPITLRARNVPNLRGAPIADPILATVGRELVGTQRRRIQP